VDADIIGIYSAFSPLEGIPPATAIAAQIHEFSQTS
jgi:hypothetical protein